MYRWLEPMRTGAPEATACAGFRGGRISWRERISFSILSSLTFCPSLEV